MLLLTKSALCTWSLWRGRQDTVLAYAASPCSMEVLLLLLLAAVLQAGLEQLPTLLSQVLENHTDEVWALQFSHDGRYLASAAKDGAVILW